MPGAAECLPTALRSLPGPTRVQETKRQLEEARAELAAERSAHDTTKQALKRESEQREAAVAAAGAAAVAVAAAPAVASHSVPSPGASPAKARGSLSPREAAEVRQQVLELEVRACFQWWWKACERG